MALFMAVVLTATLLSSNIVTAELADLEDADQVRRRQCATFLTATYLSFW